MIDLDSFRDTLAVYQKHGWELARLLTADEPSNEIAALADNASVLRWKLDAAWFTRSARPGTMTWELRYLGPSPLALVSVVDDASDLEEELEFQQSKNA
ncbi:MAG: hypothetical protein UZ17_ACD001002106 [Acidobacteria bacterium OLB17]|nr:MAG: hypothetical protein UZ17_ACD001002106 [Acidobacteria bacterium OLB17]